MRKLTFALIILTTFSCSNRNSKHQELNLTKEKQSETDTSQQFDKKTTEQPVPDLYYTMSAQSDSTINADISTLNKTYKSTPYYVVMEGGNLYIISSAQYGLNKERFDGSIKYGLANDSLRTILEPAYEKIYNPNLTIQNCCEIKSNSKIGLVNYLTGEVLQPQFEYILPSSNKPNETAFGFLEGQWYEIENTEISFPLKTEFDPVPVLRTLTFNLQNVGNNIMFDTYKESNRDQFEEGRGIIMIPSYMASLGLLENDYTDVILPDQEGDVYFGSEEIRLNTSYNRSLSDKITAFFVSIYESGIDARGYQFEARKLIVHNQQTNSTKSIKLGELSQNDYFCREAGYRFVNDSIIEVKSNATKYENDEQHYDFETIFQYHKVTKDGNVVKLTSNRYYDFTKFIKIDENNLKGCYAWRINDTTYSGEYNMWTADHLSIADLDIMRNEIFAEYGYKFKTEKWRKYFSKKPWYTAKYDDVNDRLTDLDKANIQVILEVKERMKGNEDGYRNKRKTNFVAAG